MKIQMPEDVNEILYILNSKGFNGYIVGGCVRDSILNKVSNDWDICTDATPDEMLKIFNKFKIVPTGIKHGTLTLINGDENYEITTYRIDGKYKDGRHPEQVEFTNSLKEDLRRRDFTINAIAYNDKEGLIDYFEGITDISKEIIRCVGDPFERFNEDYLRMLRAVRFSAQLGYNLHDDTFSAIKKLSKNIMYVSQERIREEFNKMLMTTTPSKGLKLLNDTNLLEFISPELQACVGFEQHNPYHDKDIFNHTLSVVDNTDSDLTLRLAALFHDIGKPQTFSLDEKGIGHFYKHHSKSRDITEKIMKRLKYDNKSISQVTTIVKEHMSVYKDLNDKSIKRFINRVGVGNLDRLFKLQIADVRGSTKRSDISDILNMKKDVERILNEKEPLSIKDLKISGYDLMKLGVPEGKEIGIILRELLELILDNPEENKKENLIGIVKENLM